jgi:hypothetical protein
LRVKNRCHKTSDPALIEISLGQHGAATNAANDVPTQGAAPLQTAERRMIDISAALTPLVILKTK